MPTSASRKRASPSAVSAPSGAGKYRAKLEALERRARLREVGLALAVGSRQARPDAQEGRPSPHGVRASVLSGYLARHAATDLAAARAPCPLRSPSSSRPTRNTTSICRANRRTSPPIAATNASPCPTISTTRASPGSPTRRGPKLSAARPRTIGQAGRLDGMTPAALTLLAAHVRRKKADARPARRRGMSDRAGRPRAGAGADSRFT